jgi:hypothetical protein
MVRIGEVSSKRLSSKSLRAEDYLYSPEKHAKRLLRMWLEAHNKGRLLNPKGAAFSALEEAFTSALAQAYAHGKREALGTEE